MIAHDPRICFLLDGKRADMPLSEFARMINAALPQTDEERFFAALDAPPRQMEMAFPPDAPSDEFPGDLKAQRMLALYRFLLSKKDQAPIETGPTLLHTVERAGIRFWQRNRGQALTDMLTDLCAAGCLSRPTEKAHAIFPVEGIDATEKIRAFRKLDKIRMHH